MPDPGTQLPVIEQLWIWNTGQSGALVITSTELTSVLAYDNAYTSVTLPAMPDWSAVNLSGNTLDQADVDGLLAAAESWNTSNCLLDLTDTTSPSPAGLTDRALLQARSWNVVLDSAWEDDFERADAADLAAVGNSWADGLSNGVACNITSGDLIRTDTGAYRVLANPAGGELPADHTVTATFAAGSLGSYIGVVGRWSAGNGVSAFFASSHTDYAQLYLHEAAGYLQGAVTLTQDAAIPASWSDSGVEHTFTLQLVGTQARIILDGVQVAHGTIGVNNTTGGGVGWSGEGQNRHLRSITVT
jgi:hypothetical protein